MEELQHWEAKCAQLEDILEKVNRAFELIPTNALQAGQMWLPSDFALIQISLAKDAIRDYIKLHWSTK